MVSGKGKKGKGDRPTALTHPDRGLPWYNYPPDWQNGCSYCGSKYHRRNVCVKCTKCGWWGHYGDECPAEVHDPSASGSGGQAGGASTSGTPTLTPRQDPPFSAFPSTGWSPSLPQQQRDPSSGEPSAQRRRTEGAAPHPTSEAGVAMGYGGILDNRGEAVPGRRVRDTPPKGPGLEPLPRPQRPSQRSTEGADDWRHGESTAARFLRESSAAGAKAEPRAPPPPRPSAFTDARHNPQFDEIAAEERRAREQASRTPPPSKGRGARPGSYGPRGGRGGDKGRGRGRGSGSCSGGTWS